MDINEYDENELYYNHVKVISMFTRFHQGAKVLIHCESDSNVRLMCQDDPRCAGIESPHAALLWCQQAKETLKASVLQDIWIYLD